jgi:hypothetical protein
MFDAYAKKLNRLYDLSNNISIEIRSLWMNNIFLSWRWFLCLAMTIIPWVLWILFRKKESSARLLFAAAVVIFSSMLLDDIGVELNIWSYNVDIDAITPSFLMWDMSVLPVVVMTFLQYKPKINPIIKAIIFSGLASFVVQPIFTWINFYEPGKWRHYYSFPLLFSLYLIAHYCTTRKTFERL